jgi:hypothetical protein
MAFTFQGRSSVVVVVVVIGIATGRMTDGSEAGIAQSV